MRLYRTSRRAFLTGALVAGAAAPLLPAMALPPALPADQVRAIVMAAHGDLAEVRALLTAEPRLLHAAWDWGGGDFETPLAAAAHTGQQAIARDLLARGARLDIFAAAMLGQLPIVQAIIEAVPAARLSRGAHRIPLLAHAEIGGEAAAPVVAYLKSFPD